MNATEFVIRARLARLSRRSGKRLTWEQRSGVHMIRCEGMPIGTMTNLAAVETFLQGYERALKAPSDDITAPGELGQAA
jgi:hypothetical protein